MALSAPRVAAAVLVLLGLGASSARAEIAVLANGQILKVTARRVDGDRVFVTLKEGGEVGLAPADLRGFVPDEVVDEVLAPTFAGTDVRALAIAAAQRHGLDPNLVLAVVAVESGFQPDAVSHKGAQGLMQLMPGTAKDLGVTDAMDPAQNLDGGTRYLRMLIAKYNGDVGRALAAYNAGPEAVKRHGGVPPYRETHHYIDRVLKRYESARAKGSEKPSK
jgi:soluble lytic murein transglycosylase-like protein